jgi:nucleoside kinase
MDVLATGYPSLDYILPVSHSPGIGETALLQAIPHDGAATYGGCGINVAVALARLGLRSGVAVVLGDDYAGSLYRARLREQHVDTGDVTTIPGEQTSRSYLFRNPNGEYQNFFFAGAADRWDGTLRLKGLPMAHYALVTVGPYRYNRQFVELARAAHVPLIWELKPDIFAFPAEAMTEFAAASTYIIMNHIEAVFVAQTLELAEPKDLLNETTQAVVITRGAEGCQVYTAERCQAVAAVPVTRVVDTTGAGDAFTAGFLAGIIRKHSLKVSAQMGSVMASFALEKIGCQTNLPTWGLMEARYKTHFGTL